MRQNDGYIAWSRHIPAVRDGYSEAESYEMKLKEKAKKAKKNAEKKAKKIAKDAEIRKKKKEIAKKSAN